jgi:shikimate dehydrogenase
MIKASVLGSPIQHSLSPVIHARAYEVLGWNWSYEKHEVSSGQLADFLKKNSGVFRGLSLTMPLKEEALTLCDSLTDLSKRVNGVNTLVFDDLGTHGYNTDVQGFIDAMRFHEVVIPPSVTVLGGGATARAAIAALDGAAQYINVYSRSAHRAKALVNSANSSIVTVHPWDEVDSESGAFQATLVISTTPKGVTDSLRIKKAAGTFFESLYDPWPTTFLAAWRTAGGFGIDGLDLLVWQAIGQLELMGFDPNSVRNSRSELYQDMRASALKALQL